MLLEKMREVGILGEDDGIRFSGCLEDLKVLGLPHTQLPNSSCGEAERVGDPYRQGRRELGIDPDRHAASTGWSIRLDAY